MLSLSAPPILVLRVHFQPHGHFPYWSWVSNVLSQPPTHFPYWSCVCAALSQPHPHFSYYSSEFTGERIPTLYEAVDLCEELDMLMFLEMKRKAHQVDTTTNCTLQAQGGGGGGGGGEWGSRGGGGLAQAYGLSVVVCML